MRNCRLLALQTEVDLVEEYWNSEHHRFSSRLKSGFPNMSHSFACRFEFTEHVANIINENASSYHNLGIAKPGTFVKTRELRSDGNCAIVYVPNDMIHMIIPCSTRHWSRVAMATRRSGRDCRCSRESPCDWLFTT